MTNPDFWLTSGFHLLERDDDGRLQVTDTFLRAYFHRPEVAPVAESCPAERALHAALLDDPRRVVPTAELDALADPDAGDNYRVLLDLRDRLVAAGTIETCYRGLFGGGKPLPPLFMDQMVHVILRNILDGVSDPVRLKAAELLFRTQKVSIQDGAILLADDEIVEMRATMGETPPANLLADDTAPQRSIELDVIGSETAGQYWERSDRFDMVVDIGFARAGLDGLCRVMEAWVAHLVGVTVTIHPLEAIEDESWSWHVGLDAEATTILNDLYNGKTLEPERQSRILSLFRLSFADPDQMLARLAGKPVYLAAAMTSDGRLRLKPQNLLVNLPLAETV